MAKKEKMKFLNTLGREVQEFKPISEKEVTMYTCGPTVYSRAHIGNLRTYIFADILRRSLEYAGYKVKQAMNITDVGHLTSDADSGEDKLQKAANETHQTAWDVSKKWTKQFLEDTKELNIEPVEVLCKATDHIKEQIALVKKLEDKGYTYRTSDGIYYNTSKFPHYGDLAKLNIEGLQAGKRIDLGEKRNKTDFALWKFSKEGEKRDMEWDSPWGKGFPGWHIECSAMSMKYLGDTFDIHTGGIDHIPVHHTNEIAQAEAATGKKFVNYWLHSDFLVMNENEKMSKSLGGTTNLDTLKEEGITPLDYRYFCLGAHYRTSLAYNKELLESAKAAHDNLIKRVSELENSGAKLIPLDKISDKGKKYLSEFKEAITNDLNTPKGLSVMWNLLKDKEVNDSEKYSLVLDFDNVLGLDLKDVSSTYIDSSTLPKEISELVEKRTQARNDKDWNKADELRDELKDKGYILTDTKEGPKIEKA